ncbi:TauD/TfdA family dioxygenase [Alphaproteobacteria bacterium]|nr:TauD/TfdA family dioxygenase [Alphaproteobacteria bacterium]
MSQTSISQVKQETSGLRLDWSDGKASFFHSIWMRDNCRCNSCGRPEIGRRQSRLSELDLNVSSSSVTVGNDCLQVSWSDGHQSSFANDWLRDNAYDETSRRQRSFVPRLWDQALRDNPPEFDFTEASQNDEVFLDALQSVRDYGICFLKNAPPEDGVLEPFASRIGPIQESNFGRIQNLAIDLSTGAVAQSAIALKPHTDEPYRASPPGILIFLCIKTDVEGAGTSTFLDGFEIAETLRVKDPEGFAVLARNNQPFRRHYPNNVDLIAEFPVVSLDTLGDIVGVRVNDRVAAPVSVPAEDVVSYYRAMKRFLTLSEDPDRILHLKLQPGDVAIFDNHRVLHGRTELTVTGPRWLQWMQIERGDFNSSLRIMADSLAQPRDANPLLRGAF